MIGTVRNAEDKTSFENNIPARAVLIDLKQTAAIPGLIASVINEYRRIDVLVNNAGFGAFGMIEEFEEEEIVHQFSVNFTAVWKLSQAVLPFMREKGQGTIVQISSRTAITAGIGNGIYAASKFAVEGMSEALKAEVEPFGIKVMLAEPGALRTDFFGNSVQYAKNELKVYARQLGDMRTRTKNLHGHQSGDPVRVANAVIDAVDKGVPSFRLPLTGVTIEAMKTKIKDFQDCIALTEKIARSVDR